ncbi:MAG: alkaline phosphatase family protein [Solirubrobacterales bacterium]
MSGHRHGEFADREAEERFAAEHPESHLRRREFLAKTAALAGAAGLATAGPASALLRKAAQVQTAAALPSPSNMPIDTFVVLMQENRSFDHYFGWRTDADAKNAGLSYPDDEGLSHATHSLAPDFQGCAFGDPNHEWDGARLEYNNGKLDGFYKASDEFALGYYEKNDIPFIPAAADAFTLYDRYFASLLGPTWPNRLYQHSATAGGNKANGQVQDVVLALANGGLYHWETIWDLMQAQGLSVGYYFSDLAFIGVFGPRYASILKSVADFYLDAATGDLPNLCFVDPMFLDGGGGRGLSGDEHPHGDIRIGQAFMADIVNAFVSSPQFRTGAMFVNYDEWGGFFDHVSPVLVPDDLSSSNLEESFGITGFRVPGVAISPYARRGHVSHMTVTHESILKLISYRFGLGYLNKRHRYASNIGRSFDWENPDFDVPTLPSPLPPVTTPCDVQTGLSGLSIASGEDAAAKEAERKEGLHIGSPEMLEYFDHFGLPTGPAKPADIFSSPDSTVKRLSRQINALGVGG